MPRQALGHHPPIRALQEWQLKRPDLFNRRVINQPESDAMFDPGDFGAGYRHRRGEAQR